MAGFELFTDDEGIVLEVTLVKDDGSTPWNLTGGTIELEVERNTTVEMTIANAAAGVAEYEVQAGDYPTPGVFTGSVKTTGIENGSASPRFGPFEFAVKGIPEVAP